MAMKKEGIQTRKRKPKQSPPNADSRTSNGSTIGSVVAANSNPNPNPNPNLNANPSQTQNQNQNQNPNQTQNQNGQTIIDTNDNNNSIDDCRLKFGEDHKLTAHNQLDLNATCELDSIGQAHNAIDLLDPKQESNQASIKLEEDHQQSKYIL